MKSASKEWGLSSGSFSLFSILSILAQAVSSAPGARDCSSLIHTSIASATYNWRSATALELAQCLISHDPAVDSCIFYTRGQRNNAIRLPHERNGTTVYDVYLPRWFNTSVYPAYNWKPNGDMRDVFRVTSKAYAMRCSGSATLVIPQDEHPCPTSIWITDEYDAIQNRLSKITLPIMKASWVNVGGAWSWIVSKLKSSFDAWGIDLYELQTPFRSVDDEEVKLKIQAANLLDEEDRWAARSNDKCGK